MYELPLEAGRADAAPRYGEAARGDRGDVSFYRSDNNFGSSSQVPGYTHRDDVSDRSGSAGSGRADNSDRTSGTVPGGAGSGPGPGGIGGEEIADTGNTSSGAAFGLLGAIGLAAVGIGAFASRRRSLSSR
jgi:hypothetical protein